MNPDGFGLQLKALENLLEEGIDCFPAIMPNFSSRDTMEKLRERLKQIRPDFAELEEEELIAYPFVRENLEETGLKQL